ncbi:MAG: trypsin-like serine protease [Elusimicrobiaceae bacterium]|nr:trypsin-like serine protease [Elusimicrobiaceae bacterium]
MKKGLLLISLLLLTLCANLRAQETDSWVVFDSNGEVVDNVEIPADEEDDFLDEELSVPGELGEDDEEYDGNIWLTNFGNVLNDGQNITGRAVGFEKAAVLLEMSYGEEDYTICSGAMVGPNLVLTAAHCLLNPYGNFPTKVVAAGMEEKNSAEVIDHWIPDQFIKYFKESSNKEMIDSER